MDVHLDMQSDEELLLQCRECSMEKRRGIVSEIARRHYQKLFQYIYRMVGSPEVAEDIIQETFLSIFKNATRYKTVAKVTTWIYRIAINLALNEIRNAKQRPHLHLNSPIHGVDGHLELVDSIPAENIDPNVLLDRQDIGEIVQRELLNLSEKYRSVLVLADLQKLTYEEIGEILNVKLGTVKSRLNRARDQFGKLLTAALCE